MKELSIIIPFYDSGQVLSHFLPIILSRLSDELDVELILVDAFQRPDIEKRCKDRGVRYGYADVARRSVQMNFGADLATSNRFFFLHIDSIPPQNFDKLIMKAPDESGCFRLAFDPPHWFLNAFAYFTRFKWAIARGGDQGLFVDRDQFYALDGFKSEWSIMEDIDICVRLSRSGNFRILPEELITSSRKYRENGVYKLQTVFTVLTAMYWLGFSNRKIKRFYRKWIK